MATRSFDVLVAKEFEAQVDGVPQTRTAWNRVGRAWKGRKAEIISIEFFHFPGQKYVPHMGEKKFETPTPFETFDQVGGEHE